MLDTPIPLTKRARPHRLRTVAVPINPADRLGAFRPGAAVRTTGAFLASDILAQLVTVAATLTLCAALFPAFDISWFLRLWPAAAVCTAVFALWGLYPGIAIHPAEEIRRTTTVISAIIIVLGLTVEVAGYLDSRALLVLVTTWTSLVITVPLFRSAVRHNLADRPWWGYPVVIIGAGDTGQRIVRYLKRMPQMGLKPVALLDDDGAKRGELYDGVPVLGGFSLAPELAVKRQIQYGMIAAADISKVNLAQLVERHGQFFKRLLVVSDAYGLPSLWTTSRSLGGLIGFEMRHMASNIWITSTKRTVDIIGSLIGLTLLIPVTICVAIAMRLDSRGPIFFRQTRMGKNGRCFSVIKYRSMFLDAEQKLRHMLEEDPELRYEYETFHKLRDDPRVTRVGKILRRYSLDELPQLWNVLKGDMSLVGPRAYLPSELSEMNGHERLILKNPPGLTGLWQVSGRNDVSFETRLDMDVDYIRNWSIWLDIYLLARTIPVVFSGKGAS